MPEVFVNGAQLCVPDDVTIDGVPHARSCQILVQSGLDIRTA